MIEVYMDGRPVPWARVKRGRTGSLYTPEKQKKHRQDLALLLKKAAKGKTIHGPVLVDVMFHYGNEQTRIKIIPFRGSARTKRPDLDNLVKQVLEALEQSGIVEDDAQVAVLRAEKIDKWL